jgi:Domain of unknown function (DUF4270)
MKLSSSLALFISILISIFITSCTDNLAEIGANIQPSNDNITVGTDTFHVSTTNLYLDSILSSSNYFLLGNYTDKKFGSTKAEILTQLMHPNIAFDPNSQVDSAKIILTYSIQGDTLSPIRINVYEMNKNTFNFSADYYSNTKPSMYCDRSVLLGQKTIKIKNNTLSKGTDTTQIKLSKQYAQHFFDLQKYYGNHDDFLTNFKGLYLTTDFGASTMLYLHKTSGIDGIANEILIRLYTHYTYKISNDTTTYITKIQRDFPANTEVRQVNCITHPDGNILSTIPSDSNYISSPANLYTKINVPLKRIKTSMNVALGAKKRMINRALLKVEVTNPNTDLFHQPLTGKLLLIKKDSLDYFFINKKLPSSTYAMVSANSNAKNATTNLIEYFYTYDLASLITNELKINPNEENIEMVLIPVQQLYSSYYAPAPDISAVTIKSGQNSSSPMRIKMVYS